MGLVMLLPTRLVMASLRALSHCAYRVMRSRREAALRSVENTLGHPAHGKQARKIVRSSFELMALNFFDPLLADRAMRNGKQIEEMVSIEGAEHLEAAFASSRPLLLCSGHYGAWEMIVVYLAHRYTPIWVSARDLDNPLLQRGLLARRSRCARGSIPKTGGAVKLNSVMRKGEALGLLLDQNAGRKGVILPFLGLPSSHHTSAGWLGRLFNATVLPVYMLRVPGEFRFHLIVEKPIKVNHSLPNDEAELDVTRRLSRSLEEMVRKHPDQWLWMHDRWRHALRVLRLEETAEPAAEHVSVSTVQGTNGA